MSKGLLIIAHGSRRESANQFVQQAFAAQKSRLSVRYSWIQVAFLELAEPSISASLDHAWAQGITDLDVFPHFLAPGAHVQSDIPRILEHTQAEDPTLELKVLPFLGENQTVMQALVQGLLENGD